MRLFVMVVAALMLVAAGCGDDDEEGGSTTTASTQQQSAGPQPLSEPLPQKTAKPNVVGGNAPIEQFSQNVFNEAGNYWVELTRQNGITYPKPTAHFVSQPVAGCNGQQFDPAKVPASLCIDPQNGAEIWYSLPVLERFRASGGDAGAAFFIGWLPSVDVNNLVSGTNPVANGNITDAFLNRSACFEGTWIAYLNERRLLEAGDAEEILKAVAEAVPGSSSAQIKVSAVQLGYAKGPAECQKVYAD